MKSISFVVLHYNQKKEIWKLFKSIYFYYKKNNNIELIICDDGSNQYSQKFLIELEKKYKFIKLILKINNTKNQSLLRNQGIKISTKEYIYFIDGDDYLFDYNFNIKNNDILFLNTFRILNKKPFVGLSKKKYISPNSFFIKKEYLLKNDIFYDELKYNWWSEDFYFGIQLIDKTKKIRYINKFNVIMTENMNSNSKEKYDNKKYIKYLNEMILNLNKKIIKNKFLLKVFLKKEIIHARKNQRNI